MFAIKLHTLVAFGTFLYPATLKSVGYYVISSIQKIVFKCPSVRLSLVLMSQDKSVLKIIFIIHAFKLMDKKKSNNFMPKCFTYLELWRSLKAIACIQSGQ